MIITDTSRAFARQAIRSAGTDTWLPQYSIIIPDDLPHQVVVHGKLQAKCYEKFAVEWCLALMLNGEPLHPITGENVGPAVADKYVTLQETVMFTLDPGQPGAIIALCSRARSTAAVSTSRLDFGNGLLQALFLPV